MKFMKFYILTFLILASTIVNGRGNGLYPDKQVEKYARISLKDKDIFLKEKLDVTETLNKEEPVTLYLFGRNEAPDFYIVITQARGRYDLFDYLIAASADLEIENVRILKYRSEHGSEIGSKKGYLCPLRSNFVGQIHYSRCAAGYGDCLCKCEIIQTKK